MDFDSNLKKNRIVVKASRGWEKVKRPFLILYFYAIIIYLPLLILRLTNDMDGLWGQDDYESGVWELSIGRWFWPWLDRARFRLSLDPLPGILALAVFVAGYMMIVRALDVQYHFTTYLGGFLFLASTGVTCQMSYSYMVLTFAMSFLLSVAAVLVIAISDNHHSWRANTGRIIASALMIAVMMGCYQSSIAVTALVSLFVFFRILSEDSSNGTSTALRFALKIFLSILLGGIFYELLLNLHYMVFHVTPASYGGFSGITPASILANLPGSIRHTYSAFRSYFLGYPFKFNALQQHRIFRILYIVPAGIMIILMLQTLHRNIRSGLLFLAGCALIPLFSSCYLLLAYGVNLQMQTTVALSLIIPLTFCAAGWIRSDRFRGRAAVYDPAGAEEPDDEQRKQDTAEHPGNIRPHRCALTAVSAAFAAAAFLLIYGAIGQLEIDSYAMYAGRRSSETLARSIVAEMSASGQDYLNGQVKVIGCPSRSSTFVKTSLYDRANDYAQYGTWPEEESVSRICWEKLFTNELRMNISYVYPDTAEDIASKPEVAAMPVWPAPGSVQYIYGVTVVKLYQPE